jgi:lysophospholipase L1-like esterase
MFLPAALAALALAQPPVAKPFEFKDGDRIVWLGSTLVEREQRYGYWETALLAANADKRITLRNLGWSGDTVHGEARGRFDFADAEKCFRQLVDQTLALKPTVIFICYGTNESFEGKDGLPKFEKGLEKLLDALKPADARIVLFPPMLFEPGVPDERNKNILLYAEAIRQVAGKRSVGFINPGLVLKEQIEMLPAPVRLTENGMHLSEEGYRFTAPVVITSLGLPTPKLDWQTLEPLRQAVVAKNELFFHRWRPQNETYLFGFRKHEQGRNAREVAEFDPLVAKAEEEIDKFRKALKSSRRTGPRERPGRTPPGPPHGASARRQATCAYPGL